MLSSIHPLGERARNNKWSVTAISFLLAATTTASLAGLALGGVGSYLPEGAWRWGVGAVAVTAAGALDLLRISPPGPRRQVNEDWIGSFRGWVYGGGFGAQLGLGAATYVVTWTVWAVAVLALVSGSPLAGAVIGATFGLGRSVFPLAAGWIDRPSRLTAFNRQMSRLAIPVTRGLSLATLAAGTVFVGLGVF